MGNVVASVLLLAGLAVPVVLSWRLRSRLGGKRAAAIAVVVGWVLNLAWAFAADASVPIAAAFGWICPAVLVSLTGLVRRFAAQRAG